MNSISLQARSQRGGTLMGFIVGLLVGLAAALSVAIYVTRVPVPFVDRGVSRNPAEDAQEAERNKGWNPNAALAGKDAAATAPAPAPAPASEGGTIVVPPADGKALPPPPAVEPRAPAAPSVAAPPVTAPTPRSGDPLGDLVQSRIGQSVPEAAAGSEPFTYFVQAGAFRTPEDAESQRAKLAMLGLSADVTEREQSGRTVFRVRLGPFTQKAQADATRDQLAARGVEAAVVRVQR
jgi:cell division protein FtsN